MSLALEDADEPEVPLVALRRVAEARGGIAKVAKLAGIKRESVYRALSAHGSPRWSASSLRNRPWCSRSFRCCDLNMALFRGVGEESICLARDRGLPVATGTAASIAGSLGRVDFTNLSFTLELMPCAFSSWAPVRSPRLPDFPQWGNPS